jgi:hypothetical protein
MLPMVFLLAFALFANFNNPCLYADTTDQKEIIINSNDVDVDSNLITMLRTMEQKEEANAKKEILIDRSDVPVDSEFRTIQQIEKMLRTIEKDTEEESENSSNEEDIARFLGFNKEEFKKLSKVQKAFIGIAAAAILGTSVYLGYKIGKKRASKAQVPEVPEKQENKAVEQENVLQD